MNIYITLIYSVEGHCPPTDSFVIYKKLVCFKFLQIIVIFPESPQTFTWVESQNPGGGDSLCRSDRYARRKRFWKTLKNTQILILKP